MAGGRRTIDHRGSRAHSANLAGGLNGSLSARLSPARLLFDKAFVRQDFCSTRLLARPRNRVLKSSRRHLRREDRRPSGCEVLAGNLPTHRSNQAPEPSSISGVSSCFEAWRTPRAVPRTITGETEMSAKEVRFSVDARDRMLRGVDILANAVKVTLGPRAAMWCLTSRLALRASPRMA